jgi:hypothetical protein
MASGIDPPRVEKLVASGSKVTDSLTFANLGERPVEVRLSIVDFQVGEDGRVEELPPGSHPSSIAPFLRISPVSAVVDSGERFAFRYSVATPEDFTQLRALVFFDAVPEADADSGRQVLFATAMGIPMYVENRRAEPGRLEVHGVELRRDEQDPQQVVLTAELSNDGERNIRAGGYLEVESAAGDFLETFVVNQAREAVLPGHRRRWQMRFGPVPTEELFLKLRFDTSARTAHTSQHSLPAVAP